MTVAMVLLFSLSGCSRNEGTTLQCTGGTVACEEACRDLQADGAHCGACDRACAVGEACVRGVCTVSCPAGETACGSACVDLTDDNGSCGACGKACPAGQVCSGGACAATCAQGYASCSGAEGAYCARLGSDAENCGACAAACPAGQQCAGGRCACPAATPDGCGVGPEALCTSFQSDRANCGGCGQPCAAGQVCSGGSCQLSCQQGLVKCGPPDAAACIDPKTSPTFCGAKGDCATSDANDSPGAVCQGDLRCANGECACPAGTPNACGTRCVDFASDRANCGGCGQPCAAGQVCSGGSCQLSCQQGLVKCGPADAAVCIDPKTSPTFCGAKGDCATSDANDSPGAVCQGAQVCQSGRCGCPAATPDACGAGCADFGSDRMNCGGCGVACAEGQLCSGGTCQLYCQPGLLKCGAAGNPTCVDPTTNPAWCGAKGDCATTDADNSPGTVCQGDQACVAGVCSCPPGAPDACGNACVDFSSDRNHCGGCNATCAAGEVCSAGTCQLSCQQGLVKCGPAGSPTCIDPKTNPTWCGAKGDCVTSDANNSPGAACQGDQTCQNGSCGCLATVANACGTSCVDFATDRLNCGRCAVACAAGEVCSSGTCQLSCQQGLVKCGPAGGQTCIDPKTSPTWCGAKGDCAAEDADNSPGAACQGAQTCVNGTCACPVGTPDVCGSSCVDFASDRNHCGDCANACGAGYVCSGGSCQLSCQQGLVKCGPVGAQTCIDPKASPAYCGAKGDCLTEDADDSPGVACQDDLVCLNGACRCPVATPNACGTRCYDLASDRQHCGACDGACAAGEVCSNGTCGLSCQEGLVKCTSSGVETCIDPTTSPSRCGAKGDCTTADASNSPGSQCLGDQLCSAAVCRCPAAAPDACGTACVDFAGDRRNCGACGRTCAAGEVCADGACVLSCQQGLVKCGPAGSQTCIDPTTSPTYCGAKGDCLTANATNSPGTACAGDQICQAGVCRCPAGTPGACGDRCYDLSGDRNHCGTCSNACGPGQICSGGNCQLSCQTGLVRCTVSGQLTCVDPKTHPARCGAKGDCATSDTNNSPGAVCQGDKTCVDGVCACPASRPVACGSACTSILGDPANCGGCGNVPSAGAHVCASGQVCSGGTCVASCGTGQTACSGACTNLGSDPNNCGACGTVCPVRPGARAACIAGACAYACNPGYVDCDGQAANGCEAPLLSDAKNCGVCGRTCNYLCRNGVCDKLLFVSSLPRTGALGGLAGADQQCQELATKVGYVNAFKAWLGTSAQPAATRLTHSPGPYWMPDHTKVAESWSDLVDGTLLHPIDVCEYGWKMGYTPGSCPIGLLAWTATGADGSWTGQDCSNWTSSLDTVTGGSGDFGASDSRWAQSCLGNIRCGAELYLYCIEQ